MRVGTRITVATSGLVATTLLVYSVLEERTEDLRQRKALEAKARESALVVRSILEEQGNDLEPPAAQGLADAITRSTGEDVSVSILPTSVLRLSVFESDEVQRLRTLVEARPTHLLVVEEDTVIYTLPWRLPSPSDPEGFVIGGSIEVVLTSPALEPSWARAVLQGLPVLALVVGLLIIAITLLARTLITYPIGKLLAGIDDVAQGDLSRVLLSEREDEIGSLATRFNEMTQSLRDSQGETARENEARVSLEQRLLRSEKMATIGQLAAEIAHEVGTPLNVIAARAQGLGRKAGNREVVEKNAQIIAEQASRITRIIQRLLDVARPRIGAIEAEPVDVSGVCQSTLDFLDGRLASANVKPKLTVAPSLPPVSGHPDQLQQVLINLIINGIEAMPDGGTLFVETRRDTRRRPGLERAPEVDCVVVEVGDTGAGVPAELRDKIFEPFYTSKDHAGGTGLGLAVSSGIIKEHDGWLEVDDRPGGPGTVFRVCIPAKSD